MQLEVLLLDVEGTTTPISFVRDVLFPYALEYLHPYLEEHAANVEMKSLLDNLLSLSHNDEDFNSDAPQTDQKSDLERVERYMRWLSSKDRKVTAWKELQGCIWRDGYETSKLKGAFFEDVPIGLRQWLAGPQSIQNTADQSHATDIRRLICIYSSGSCEAQKLIYRYSQFNDMSGFISGYFDTMVGAKFNAEAYVRIGQYLKRLAVYLQDKDESKIILSNRQAEWASTDEYLANDVLFERSTDRQLAKLELAGEELEAKAKAVNLKVLFLTDVLQEANAARQAGFDTRIVLRPGNAPISDYSQHATISSFDELRDFSF